MLMHTGRPLSQHAQMPAPLDFHKLVHLHMHMNTADELGALITPQACSVLGIDRSTLTRWVRSGRIEPTGKLPGRTGAFLFTRAEVDRVKRELDAERRRRERASTRRAKAAS